MRKRQKNYLPTLILTLILWSFLLSFIFYVEPELVKDIFIKGLYFPFFSLFIPVSFLSLTLIFGPKGLRKKASFSATDCLEYFLNLLLITGIVIAIDMS